MNPELAPLILSEPTKGKPPKPCRIDSRPKPKFGAPCNHCGLCCSLQLCPAGVSAFPGRPAPCPALTTDRLCALVLAEAQAGLEPMLRNALGIGTGCSMPDADTTADEIEEADRRARKALGISVIEETDR